MVTQWDQISVIYLISLYRYSCPILLRRMRTNYNRSIWYNPNYCITASTFIKL